MKRTIDISLQGSDTNVTLSQDFTTQRMVMVSLSKAGFTSNSDGSNRSITVSFGTLQTEVRWGDIANKPNGKLFGGVITPASAIPTTNADVYYMAYEAGFYTNFGFTLTEGTMAFVYRFGNGWIRTTVSMDTVGFVQGTRENQIYFNNSEMDELRKSVAFYYGREGFFMKTAESDEVMTFTLVASAINIDGANVASFYLRGARMFVNKTPDEGTDDYHHWFDGESTQFYLKDAIDQIAAYFEENKQDTLTFDSTPTEGSTNPVQSGGVYEALANLLADGCLYGGIVNPNSEPSDDKRFFYIAETQGVYTHFDNLELNGNSLFIIHWDNYFETWIMDSFGENHEGIEQDIAKRFNLLYLDLGFDRFSPHASYSAYDYVTNIEIGGLWRFNTNHHGVWNENDVDQVTLVDYIDDLLNRKQDVILDLATIRSGAAAGATAYQKPSTGIPKTDLASAVQTSLGKADTAYQMPSTGIPASDLASAVQTSLGKADTALQTETDPTVPYWAKQSTKPSYDYSEIGNTPDLSGFITKNVNDLANYYLKSETYTKTEVGNLIAAINQFHYEIAASTSAVTNPQSNVLYLIGPVGSGSDKYEEYIYPDSTTGWVKIGDTSIDLSGYVTTSALNTALADYTTSDDLATLLAGYQTKIDSQHKLDYSLLSNTPTIPTVPTNVSAFTNDAGYLTQHQDISGKADKVSYPTSGNFAGLDSNGNLIDSGSKASDFATAAQGALADSSIQGVSVNGTALTPSSGVVNVSVPTSTSDLTNDSGFVNTATTELTHYYTKTQTYTQSEVDDLVASASDFEYVVVSSLPTASASTKGKFYLYNGHRYVTTGNDPYTWTDLGSYDIDLTGYVSETDLEDALEDRPIFQLVTETQMQNMLDNETWEEGVIYYTEEE